MPVDLFIKTNKTFRDEDKKSYRYYGYQPNKLFIEDIDNPEAEEEEVLEVCPCCKEKNHYERKSNGKI